MTANYKSRHGSLSWCKQPSYTSGLRVATPATFTTTSAGNAGGTTAVATGLAGANNAQFVGYIVECVKATSVQNVGCRAMVLAFDYTTNTLTFDQAFPAQVASGDSFRMYTTPDAPVIATSAVAGGATIIATALTQADDYWNGAADMGGYYLETVSADNASAAQHPLISDFTASSDTLTLGTSLGVNVAIGDFFRLLKHPFVEGVVMLPPERPDMPASTLVAGYGSEPAMPGNRGGGGAAVLYGRGPGKGREGLAAEIDEALSCVLTANAARTGVVVHTGSSTSSVVYDSGSPDVGDVLVTGAGDAFVVTADSGTALTPSPPLRSAPVDGETLTGARHYDPCTNLAGALTVYNWLGSGLLNIFYGVVPTPTFEFGRGDHSKVNLQLRAADFYQGVGERSWYPRLPTSRAQRTRDMRFVLHDGSTSLTPALLSATFDPGIETKELVDLGSPNETAGFDIVNVQAKGTARVRVDATYRRLLRDWQGKRGLTLLIQEGAIAGDPGIRGVWAYDVRLDSVGQADDAGELVFDLAFTVCRNETGLGLSLPQYKVFWS